MCSPSENGYSPSSGGCEIPGDCSDAPAVGHGLLAPRSASDSASLKQQLCSFISEKDVGRYIYVADLVDVVVKGAPREGLELEAKTLINILVEEGVLERLFGDLYRRVPPVPEHGSSS